MARGNCPMTINIASDRVPVLYNEEAVITMIEASGSGSEVIARPMQSELCSIRRRCRRSGTTKHSEGKGHVKRNKIKRRQ